MDKEDIFERVQKDNVRYVLLQFSDINGMVKNLAVPVSELQKVIELGAWFDGSSIGGFTRIYESDMYVKPVLSTYAVIPWLTSGAGNTARFICDVYTPDGMPYQCDPRSVLKKITREAEAMGYGYHVGPEPEFFLFKRENGLKPLPHDCGGYFDLNLDKAFQIRAEMMENLQKMGIEVEASHHEVAYGQHEIDFQYRDALTTADNIITFKFTLKGVAEKHGLHATFMPKPIFGINGSGMHCHQSLYDLKTGANKFYSAEDSYNLSKIARSFIAGQLKHIRGLSAVIAPLVNSYKRLVPGYEAPVYICWAKTNRSALIRIPKFAKGKESSARAEIRCPDPSCNPYLALAVLLKAGLAGIQENLEAPDPIEEDVYHFDDTKLKKLYVNTMPGSLGESLDELRKSEIAKEVLGQELLRKFSESREAEWNEYSMTVHEWELSRYLEKY